MGSNSLYRTLPILSIEKITGYTKGMRILLCRREISNIGRCSIFDITCRIVFIQIDILDGAYCLLSLIGRSVLVDYPLESN